MAESIAAPGVDVGAPLTTAADVAAYAAYPDAASYPDDRPNVNRAPSCAVPAGSGPAPHSRRPDMLITTATRGWRATTGGCEGASGSQRFAGVGNAPKKASVSGRVYGAHRVPSPANH